eukprot:tig00021348_g20573.t1
MLDGGTAAGGAKSACPKFLPTSSSVAFLKSVTPEEFNVPVRQEEWKEATYVDKLDEPLNKIRIALESGGQVDAGALLPLLDQVRSEHIEAVRSARVARPAAAAATEEEEARPAGQSGRQSGQTSRRGSTESERNGRAVEATVQAAMELAAAAAAIEHGRPGDAPRVRAQVEGAVRALLTEVESLRRALADAEQRAAQAAAPPEAPAAAPEAAEAAAAAARPASSGSLRRRGAPAAAAPPEEEAHARRMRAALEAAVAGDDFDFEAVEAEAVRWELESARRAAAVVVPHSASAGRRRPMSSPGHKLASSGSSGSLGRAPGEAGGVGPAAAPLDPRSLEAEEMRLQRPPLGLAPCPRLPLRGGGSAAEAAERRAAAEVRPLRARCAELEATVTALRAEHALHLETLRRPRPAPPRPARPRRAPARLLTASGARRSVHEAEAERARRRAAVAEAEAAALARSIRQSAERSDDLGTKYAHLSATLDAAREQSARDAADYRRWIDHWLADVTPPPPAPPPPEAAGAGPSRLAGVRTAAEAAAVEAELRAAEAELRAAEGEVRGAKADLAAWLADFARENGGGDGARVGPRGLRGAGAAGAGGAGALAALRGALAVHGLEALRGAAALEEAARRARSEAEREAAELRGEVAGLHADLQRLRHRALLAARAPASAPAARSGSPAAPASPPAAGAAAPRPCGPSPPRAAPAAARQRLRRQAAGSGARARSRPSSSEAGPASGPAPLLDPWPPSLPDEFSREHPAAAAPAAAPAPLSPFERRPLLPPPFPFGAGAGPLGRPPSTPSLVAARF